MLTDKDIEFMRNSHKQVYTKRTHDVLLVYKDEGNYFGSMGFPEVDVKEESAKAVITYLSRMSNLHRKLVDSIEIEDGDIHVDVDMEYLRKLDDLPVQVIIHEGEKEVRYEVINANPKGIGERNRVEFWARKLK